MIPEALKRDAVILAQHDFCFEIVPDGLKIYIQFKDFPLPAGLYNADTTGLLIFTTSNYPNAGFDMFWTDPSLALRDGRVPKQADQLELHLGQNWRRFSYHPYNEISWNPSEDNVVRFVAYVQQRLRNGD